MPQNRDSPFGTELRVLSRTGLPISFIIASIGNGLLHNESMVYIYSITT